MASLHVNERASDHREFGVSNTTLVIAAIRIGCVALLAYWSLVLVRPFLTIIIWSVIFAVSLYPVFDWLAIKLGGYRRVTAILVTLFSVLVILGPATWLGMSLAVNLRSLMLHFGDGSIVIPAPFDSVKDWPLIGGKVYETWYVASTNLSELIIEASPYLKRIGGTVLGAAGDAGLNVTKFVLAAIISGFLLVPGPSLVRSVKDVLSLIATKRGEEFIDLAGATIRTVSRGVIGISVLQSLLAGLGLMIAGVPAAGLFSFLVLLLGIIQIGPSFIIIPIIVWSWFNMAPTAAAIFTAYMVPTNLLDNILRPFVMTRGLSIPMPVILAGVFGGMLAHGLIGLFIGPIVLSIAWQLLATWSQDEKADDLGNHRSTKLD
jgi:predicted PurR-regulated permease PerM